MTQSEIVHNEDGRRTVSVNRNYNDGVVTELYLICEGSTADLVHVSSEDRPEKFGVGAEVMDRIAEAWQQYRADEQIESEECIKEAYTIAEKRGIDIEQVRDRDRWIVKCEGLTYRYPCSPRQLLATVKEISEDEELFPQEEEEN